MTTDSKKPFYSSIMVIVVLPLAMFVVAGTLVISLGLETLNDNYIDDIIHVFSGATCISFISRSFVAFSASGNDHITGRQGVRSSYFRIALFNNYWLGNT
jgi:hypothetical protein